MRWLNYHHLQYFWMVAKTGSVTAAAKELRLAHPTVSAQIRALEKSLGHELFRHAGRHLELTEAGMLAYRYANDIFSLGEELQQSLEGRGSGGSVRLKVGITDVLPKPIAYQFLKPALRLPGVQAACFEGTPTSLMKRLLAHELDIVLSDFPLGPQFTSMAFSHLLGECPVSLFASGPLMRKYDTGFPACLDGAPFLLPTENASLRRLLNHWFTCNQIRPRIVAEFEDSELLKEHGQDGGGIFAVSALIEDHTLRHYRVKRLRRLEELHMRYYAISTERRIVNPAVTAIVDSAHREIFG